MERGGQGVRSRRETSSLRGEGGLGTPVRVPPYRDAKGQAVPAPKRLRLFSQDALAKQIFLTSARRDTAPTSSARRRRLLSRRAVSPPAPSCEGSGRLRAPPRTPALRLRS